MIKITDMTERHIKEVVQIEKVSFPTPWPRQTFEFEILYNELAEYLVALDGRKVVGYGGMWMVLNEAHITNLAVHPQYRGIGIGRMLMLSLMQRAVSLDADRMTLEVRPSNGPARDLYHSLGFMECGLRKGYYQDNNEDAIIMWREKLKGSNPDPY
ncbi:MAG: ribosomal-protein-alanine N-acetyltransferase [Desulforudis sp.]|jgi:ribosomal-protein-alanine N-acetyltransferase|nr:ribosomal protein S18-alanine N-acetyltransferase [Clostridia bacterium]MDQ7791324.1 ribosomal protein S18-alanine N-acetyltransferase [Clostridia bacterium]RJX19304.1 MAG: ribosomal-protein-alanine N-acetyltransferase [Desulforudis sp.]